MRAIRLNKELGAIALCLVFMVIPKVYSAEEDVKLSLDKLFNLKVATVSGTAMDMKKSPEAIYVITHDDIRRLK